MLHYSRTTQTSHLAFLHIHTSHFYSLNFLRTFTVFQCFHYHYVIFSRLIWCFPSKIKPQNFQSKIFHTNFTSVMLSYYAHGYFFAFTRTVLSCFQNGFIALGGKLSTSLTFTFNSSESTSLSYQILLIFSEFRFYELFIGIFLFVSLVSS